MNEIVNYFERKGITIWNQKDNDIEGAKDSLYMNIIKNDLGYLVIMSILGEPRFTHKQLENLDEAEIRKLFNRMKNAEIYRDPEISDYEFSVLFAHLSKI